MPTPSVLPRATTPAAAIAASESVPRSEERDAGERAHRADRDRAVLHLERQRLPGPDEGGDREQAEDIVAASEDETGCAGGHAGYADDDDERRQGSTQLQEGQFGGRVRVGR